MSFRRLFAPNTDLSPLSRTPYPAEHPFSGLALLGEVLLTTTHPDHVFLIVVSPSRANSEWVCSACFRCSICSAFFTPPLKPNLNRKVFFLFNLVFFEDFGPIVTLFLPSPHGQPFPPLFASRDFPLERGKEIVPFVLSRLACLNRFLELVTGSWFQDSG